MRCYLCGAARFAPDLADHSVEDTDGKTLCKPTCVDNASCFRRAHANATIARRAAGERSRQNARRRR